MFKHLTKLIWNKKRQNALMIIEILISFLAIFGVFSFAVNMYNNYKKPIGIKYENVWAINYTNSLQTANGDSLALFYQTVLRNIKSMPKVIDATLTSGNIPFSFTHVTNSISYNGEQVSKINQFSVDGNYLNTLGVKLLSGNWYGRQQEGGKVRTTIINKSLKERLFGKNNAIGEYIDQEKEKFKIIGVIEDIKFNGDYEQAGLGMYTQIDTGSYKYLSNILVKVEPGADAAFEGELSKLMSNSLKNATVEIEHLNLKLDSYNQKTIIPLTILLIVAGFLVVNVALGLFGVLWYNINKRKGEIGLRRAIGATGDEVAMQLIVESLILTTFALLIGCFFAIQFPLLHVFDLPALVYLTALGLSVVFIYLLVLLCSIYPGRQATAIYPAVALHEE